MIQFCTSQSNWAILEHRQAKWQTLKCFDAAVVELGQNDPEWWYISFHFDSVNKKFGNTLF